MAAWQPSASILHLRQRANLIMQIRDFFNKRGVLEVETPLLSHATVTDPHIKSIPAIFQRLGTQLKERVFLQTSPEYAMKRLLAAGIGPIYQITKAFRQGELGRLHNPEFSMLEWYRPDFDHHDLMDEMDALLQTILGVGAATRITVEALFKHHLNINYHHASLEDWQACAKQNHIQIEHTSENQQFWMDLLFSHCIEPNLGQDVPVFIYDFPVSQAALARIRPETPPVASRFEVYFKSTELANGFHELRNPEEQRLRFEKDLRYRAENNLDPIEIDERFLSCLESLPDCAGVAMGIDRLMMLALGCKDIKEVLSFGFSEA